MDSSDKEALKRLQSLSECCICLKSYVDPRLLPCLHSACLNCFEDMRSKNNKKPGDVLPCPICRTKFSIPPEGITGLQRNFFIESLLEVTMALKFENKSVPCTMCSINEEVKEATEATMRCLNCSESYCLRCSKMHKNLKATKDHRIVDIINKFHDEEIRNSFPNRKCKNHSDKDLDYYCGDCKTVVCVSCFVEDHKMHECKDVRKIDKDFRQRLEDNSTKMSDYTERIISKKLDMKRQKKEYLAKITEIENGIKRINQQLKALIDQHTQDILTELCLLSQNHQKQIEAEIDETERKLTVIESFVTYCTELKLKGSPSEVCGSADSLIARAEELSKENGEYLRAPNKSFDIEFIATDQNTLLQSVSSVIGKLAESTKLFESCTIVIGIHDGGGITEDVVKINLNQSEDVSVIQQTPIKMTNETAATIHCDSIFITGTGSKCDEIWKFDATSSSWMQCVSLIQGRRRHSMAFLDHFLYICGGYVDSNKVTLDDVEVFDILNNKTATVGKLDFAVHSSGNCVPVKSSLYIFGGYDANKEAVNKVQVYDTKFNTCALLSKPMPRAHGHLRAVMWENIVILFGRYVCFTYNFETEFWETRAQFRTDVLHFGLAISNGLVFVIGGGKDSQDADGNNKWICRDDVRYVPVLSILNDEPINWRRHALLPKPSLVFAFARRDLFV